MIADLKSIAIAAVIGLLVGLGAAWTIQGWRIDAIKADFITEKAAAIEEENKRANQIANDYAEVVRWLQEQRQTRTVTVVKELEKPVYRSADCVLPDSGRMLINDAVRQANAARLGSTALPSPAGAAAAANDGRPDAVGVKPSGGIRGLRVQ